MSNTILTQRVELITLSPIHIGSGQRLYEHEYIASKDLSRLFVIDEFSYRRLNRVWMDRFLQLLKNEKKLTSEHIRKFYEDLPDQEKEKIASFIIDNKFKINLTDPYIAKQIILNIKTSHNRAYIPGSSLKGSLVTAILYYLFKNLQQNQKQLIENMLETNLKTLLKRFKGRIPAREKKKLSRYLIDSIFKFVGKNRKRDFLYITKFLGVRDSTLVDKTILYKLFIIDHPAHKTHERPPIPIEAIETNTHVSSEIFFNTSPEILSEIGVKSKDNSPRFGLTAYKSSLGKTLTDMSIFSWNYIWEAVKTTVSDLIHAELSFLENIRDTDSQFFTRKFVSCYNFYKSLKSAVDALPRDELILRVGFGSGFKFTTLTFLLNPKLRESILRKTVPKLVSPANRDINMFPVSRRLVSNNRQYLPLGWIKIKTY